jgi:hypothetical protein
VAAAVRHDGNELPPWPTAAAALTAVDHSGRVSQGLQPAAAYRRESRRLEVRAPWVTTVGLFRRDLCRLMFIFDKLGEPHPRVAAGIKKIQ